MLMLSDIRHFVRIALFIASTPPPQEAQLSTLLRPVKDEDCNSQGQVV